MEIQVGEYVRTYDGIIGEVKYVDSINIIIKTKDEDLELSTGIKNHSFNIAELIEPEDFVNDFKVSRKDGEVIIIKDYFGFNRGIEVQNIKSIVTKEQFESIKYEV